MSSADAQRVFNQRSASDHEESQNNFAQHFDLENPADAMSSYQKMMHQHTMGQFKSATASSKRRSSKESTNSFASEQSDASPTLGSS